MHHIQSLRAANTASKRYDSRNNESNTSKRQKIYILRERRFQSLKKP